MGGKGRLRGKTGPLARSCHPPINTLPLLCERSREDGRKRESAERMVDRRRHDIGVAWPGATRHDAAWHDTAERKERCVAAFLMRKRSLYYEMKKSTRSLAEGQTLREIENEALRLPSLIYNRCNVSRDNVELNCIYKIYIYMYILSSPLFVLSTVICSLHGARENICESTREKNLSIASLLSLSLFSLFRCSMQLSHWWIFFLFKFRFKYFALNIFQRNEMDK